MTSHAEQIIQEVNSSNSTLITFWPDLLNDTDIESIADALEQNTTIERLTLLGHHGVTWSTRAVQRLAIAISRHPTLHDLRFWVFESNMRLDIFARALREKETPISLDIFRCNMYTDEDIPPISGLSMLLEDGSIDSLNIFDNVNENVEPTGRLGIVLARGNRSLKELCIDTRQTNLQDIAALVRNSDTLQSLKLVPFRVERTPEYFRAMSMVAAAVEQSTTLTKLSLRRWIPNEPGDFRAFERMLQNSQTLCTFEMTLSKHNEVAESQLRGLTSETCAVEQLEIDISSSADVSVLADALQQNSSVTHLVLRSFGVDGDAVRDLGALFSTSETLSTLTFYGNGEGVMAIAEQLPRMHSLRHLSFPLSRDFATPQVANEFVANLEENFTLQQAEFYSDSSPNANAIRPRVNAILARNVALGLAGWSYLRTDENEPPFMWAQYMARMSNVPDVVLHFLRERHDVFFSNI